MWFAPPPPGPCSVTLLLKSASWRGLKGGGLVIGRQALLGKQHQPIRSFSNRPLDYLRLFRYPDYKHTNYEPSRNLHIVEAMAPNKKDGGGKKPSANKVVEDRTFGMKNKKGAVAKKQIAQMTAQMQAGGNAEQKRKEAEKAQREREKKAAEAAKKEADMLLNKPAQIQKVPFGVDPKTVVCIFFKKGNCEKGKKCKFSHNLDVERKTEKINLYQDTRAQEEEKKKAETSADWDEEQLRKVVLSKKGNQRTTTDKVCKYFIEAIEDGKYGWFWTCPNGGDKCMYKHALPPGYVVPPFSTSRGYLIQIPAPTDIS